MNINITIYEGNNTINVADYTPTVTLTVVDNLYQSGGGGGAVDSVNGKTGVVVLGANDIAESATLFWLTDALKSAYNQAVTTANSCASWISSNGTNLLNHLSNTSNPHSVTASQVGLGNVNNTSDANKPISTATQTALDLKANASDVAIVLFKSITQTIVTGKTLETAIYAIPLPTDGSDYIIQVYSQAQIGSILAGGVNHLLRVGTYPSPIDGLTGANSIGVQTPIAVNAPIANSGFGIDRTFIFKGGASGSIVGLAPSANILTDKYSTLQFITLASKDFTTQHYLYVAFRTTHVGHIITHNVILVTAIKI
jgi:hypothetical protein